MAALSHGSQRDAGDQPLVQEQLLSYARDLVATSWTQHAEARDAARVPVDACSPEAVSWSLLGALRLSYERFAWNDGHDAAAAQLVRSCALLADVIDSDSLPGWNDRSGRTQADVLDALDAAQR